MSDLLISECDGCEALTIELEGVRILLPDAGCDELAASGCAAGLAAPSACGGALARALPRVDCALVCAAHSLVAPAVLELCARAAARIYATEPMVALLRAELSELERSARFDLAPDGHAPEERPGVGLATIAAVRSHLVSVVYGQRVRVGPLTLTATSAGGVLGAAHWSVRASSGFCLAVAGPACEPARAALLAAPYALRPNPVALRPARALLLPRCALAARRGAGAPQQPAARAPALVGMLSAVCAALRAPEAGLEPLVVLTQAHGALAEALEALGRVLDNPAAHGLRPEATELRLVLVAPSAPPLLAFCAAAPEWHLAERQRHAMGPNYLYPFGGWQKGGRLVLARNWAGAAPYVREGAELAARAILLCSAQAWEGAPPRPSASTRWLAVPLDAPAARAVERRAGAAGAGEADGQPLLAREAAGLTAERLLSWEGALALLAASGAAPTHVICHTGRAAHHAAGAGGEGGDGGLSPALAREVGRSLRGPGGAPAEPPAVLLLHAGGGSARVPTADGSSFRAQLSDKAARALVARRTADSESAFAAARLLLVAGAQDGEPHGLALELPVARAPGGPARGRVGGAVLWGAPDPRRVLGALEQLGFDAECVACAPLPAQGSGAAGARGARGEGARCAQRVEVRLLGQYAGATLAIGEGCSEVVVDARMGIGADAALVARRALRQVVLDELLGAEC